MDKVDDADVVATATAAALAAAGERSVVDDGLGMDAVVDVMLLSLDDEEIPTMLPMVVRFLAH